MKRGSLTRTSGRDGGYYDGTALSILLPAGSSQTISFSAGFASTAYKENWDLYIDYNQDGDFADAGENVVGGSSSSGNTLSATFTMPTSAKSGKTRLRLVMSDKAATTSCGAYSYGETEDYSVVITNGSLAADNSGVAGLTGTTTLDAWGRPGRSCSGASASRARPRSTPKRRPRSWKSTPTRPPTW